MLRHHYVVWGAMLGAAVCVGCDAESDVEDAREEVIEERQETMEAEAEHAEAEVERRMERADETTVVPVDPTPGYTTPPATRPGQFGTEPVTPGTTAPETTTPGTAAGDLDAETTPGQDLETDGAELGGDRPSAVEAAEAESASSPAATGEGSPDTLRNQDP